MNEFLPLQRPKIGFFLQDIGPSELSFSILYKGMNSDIDTFVFYEYLNKPPINHLACLMHYSEAYAFDGPLISTDLNTTIKSLQLPVPNPKVFFINDLEWIRMKNKQYEPLAQIYRNTNLLLVARSEDHRRMIESCWNVTVWKILPKYDFFTPEFTDSLFFLNTSLYGSKQKLANKKIEFTNSILNIKANNAQN